MDRRTFLKLLGVTGAAPAVVAAAARERYPTEVEPEPQGSNEPAEFVGGSEPEVEFYEVQIWRQGVGLRSVEVFPGEKKLVYANTTGTFRVRSRAVYVRGDRTDWVDMPGSYWTVQGDLSVVGPV